MSSILQAQQIQSVQYLHSLDPATLLPLELAAPLINMSLSTLRGYVTRQPEAIPTITRIGRRVYIQKGDIDSFKAARRIPAPVAQGRGVRHG